MGFCSYALIGFWYAKESARDAAVKAFLTTRIGAVFMLLGLVALYSQTGSVSFATGFYLSPLTLCHSRKRGMRRDARGVRRGELLAAARGGRPHPFHGGADGLREARRGVGRRGFQQRRPPAG